MSSGRRKGLRPDPSGGWPLDRLFVGTATVRTTRELFRQHSLSYPIPRAWDLALWSGVTPQGSTLSLKRLGALGLVDVLPSARAGYAPTFRLDRGHPFFRPLADLFAVEEARVRRQVWEMALSHRKRRMGSP